PFSSTAPSPTELYPLSLHDALPIYPRWLAAALAAHRVATRSSPDLGRLSPVGRGCAARLVRPRPPAPRWCPRWGSTGPRPRDARSEEHTSELQSRENLVCRLLLEKK